MLCDLWPPVRFRRCGHAFPVPRYTIGRHCLLLDEAHDMLLAEKLAAARGHSFFGMGFCTDESPPSEPRFTGLRFQISYVYIPLIAPASTWGSERYDRKPPLTSDHHLLDIIHCPAKDGATVMHALDLQLSRIGCSRLDLVSGTGDGGGENEGGSGIHGLIERENGLYIRRRCLGHISWRVADAGIAAMGQSHKEVGKLCAYLREGITWRRLQALATQPVGAGGLGLMTETSEAFAKVFLKAPGAIIEARPECDAQFLQWLLRRERTLAPLVRKDIEGRELGPDAQAAMECLQGWTKTAIRWVNLELLKKSLMLFYWVFAHQHICGNTSFDALVERASTLIMDMSISEEFLKRIELLPTDASLQGITTWVEVVARVVAPNHNATAEFLPDLLEHHRKVATRMVTHLGLTCNNVMRFSWLLGGMLSPDAEQARSSARQAQSHLLRVPAAHRTLLEQSLMADDNLMAQLGQFADMHPPCLLWRNNAKFADLFRLLAVRFHSNPDHVLHCEGTHAKWQWLTLQKRGLKFKLLNAILKLQARLHHFGCLEDEDMCFGRASHSHELDWQ
jgi:hypothetical protein